MHKDPSWNLLYLLKDNSIFNQLSNLIHESHNRFFLLAFFNQTMKKHGFTIFPIWPFSFRRLEHNQTNSYWKSVSSSSFFNCTSRLSRKWDCLCSWIHWIPEIRANNLLLHLLMLPKVSAFHWISIYWKSQMAFDSDLFPPQLFSTIFLKSFCRVQGARSLNDRSNWWGCSLDHKMRMIGGQTPIKLVHVRSVT